MVREANDVSMDIARRLTAIRLQNAWTREDLSGRAKINIYTLKHFERTGQISLERLISLCSALDVLPEFQRAFKPRQRIAIEDWSTIAQISARKRGRRKAKTRESYLAVHAVREGGF